MKNEGKKFEEDFGKSCIPVMDITRLKDSPSSFNPACFKCEHKKIRFTLRNICDFIGYKYPNMFYLELKSHKGKSIPFTAICKNSKDTRIYEMAMKAENKGIFSFIIFNWRDCDNETYAVSAELVNNFINYADRKSIPFDWVKENGVRIHHRLKRVRYSYDIGNFLEDFK